MKSKRLVAVLCSIAIPASLSACDNNKTYDTEIPIEIINNEEISPGMKETATPTEADSASENVEKLNDIVAKDVEDKISALNAEYTQLKSEINTFNNYMNNSDKVEAFYTKIYETHKDLCVRMCEYSLDYAEIIVGAEESNDQKYDNLEELYDAIYDNARDDIYDEIYDGILDDMYNNFYDGFLDDAYDDVEYSIWSEARSNEYDWWSNTRSDVYDDWSDCFSDIYDFWSDIRSEVWDDNIERAKKIIEDFREDVKKLKGNSSQQENDISSDKSIDTPIMLVNGMYPELKEAIDSFDFFNEYYRFYEEV